MRRKICIITGTRADYGLLKPLIDCIGQEKSFIRQLIVTGAHLVREQGYTIKNILEDKINVDYKIDMHIVSDSSESVVHSMGVALNGFAKAYQKLKPEVIVVLGDRYEILCAVSSAAIFKIPVVHIHGGELTFGAIDDMLRHAITKMSYLHFTATEKYRQRVIQLGEAPQRVFKVGSLGLDNIRNLKLLSKEKLVKDLNIQFNKHNVLVTFHPVTLENNTSQKQFQNLLAVLDKLENTNIVFTKANADTDGRIINKMIKDYVAQNHHKAWVFASLGQLRYLSLMQYVDSVVGNSSSGIIEAPSFKIGTINIGDRQEGRIKPGSVVDCDPTIASIKNAFKKMYSEAFQMKLLKVKNPYGDGKTAPRICEILRKTELTTEILKKIFYDIHS